MLVVQRQLDAAQAGVLDILEARGVGGRAAVATHDLLDEVLDIVPEDAELAAQPVAIAPQPGAQIAQAQLLVVRPLGLQVGIGQIGVAGEMFAGDEELAVLRRELEARLNGITRDADEATARTPVEPAPEAEGLPA